MQPVGRALTALPRQLGIEDEDARACASAVECFACCYAIDLGCTVPFMRDVEADPRGRDSLSLFAFYEVCWPCLRLARACGLVDDARIRTLARQTDPLRTGYYEAAQIQSDSAP